MTTACFGRVRSFRSAKCSRPATTITASTSARPTWRGGHLTLDASQQRLRGNVNGNILVPAVYERTPLATDPAVRAFVQRILDGYPDEEPNRTDIDPHALNTNAPQIINNDNIGGTLDQQFSENDQLVLRYQLTSQKVDAFQLYGGQNPDTTTKSHDARTSWIHSWSPSTVSEFSGGFKRIGSLLVSDETSIGPVILTSNLWEYLGPSSDIPIDRAQNEFRYAGALRHTRGRHLYTAGFELLRRQVNGVESNSHRGLFSFRADFGQDNVTNILQGRPSSYSIALGNAHRGFRNWEMQYYFGDDWKVNSDLTLNVGLRFQPVTAPDEVNGLTNIPYRCDCNNWAPRFGAAYRLGRSGGVLRAAYGTHFGSIYTVTYSQARFNSPQVVRLSLPQPDILNPLGGIDPDDIDPNQPSVLFDLVDDLVAPYSHQYNFSWEREVFGKATLRLGYVGSRSPKAADPVVLQPRTPRRRHRTNHPHDQSAPARSTPARHPAHSQRLVRLLRCSESVVVGGAVARFQPGRLLLVQQGDRSRIRLYEHRRRPRRTPRTSTVGRRRSRRHERPEQL